jgi:hypothetical protein
MTDTILENNVIFIRSKDATLQGVFLDGTGVNRAAFGLYMKKKLISADDELFKVIVQNAIIPYTYNNTNATNNFFDWSENGVLLTPLQITPGNYNILEMAEEIQAEMNSATTLGADNYTVTYNGISNKLNITSESALNTILLLNTGTNILKSIGVQIGFTDDADITFNSAAPATSDSVVNLISIHSLFIRSNLSSLNTIDSVSMTNSDILVTIPVNVNPLEVISYQYYEGVEYNLIGNNTIDYIEFSLTDQNGNLIDLQKEINWELVLNIQTIKNPKFFRNNTITDMDERVPDSSDLNTLSSNPLETDMIDMDVLQNKTREILKTHEQKQGDVLNDYKNKLN